MTASAELRVLRSSPFAQLQDGGRFGVRHLGVTQSGALDWQAQRWANWLLGNPLQAAVLEILLGNLQLECCSDSTLALTGADLGATLDGEPLAPWRTFRVRAGQQLAFNQPRQGARAYLAVPGGLDAPVLLGSCAGVARERLGGLHGDGSGLGEGDRLRWQARAVSERRMPAAQIPDYSLPPRLQLVLGAQHGDFAGQSLFDAFNADWTLDQRADRMGVRLCGPLLRYLGAPMISEGLALGSLQVPPDGQPIALLNDRQTIGGYPRLGALTPEAVARLAQCLPGDTLRLTPVTQAAAQERQRRLLQQWQSAAG